ncbi:hypothetical protein [Flavisphingomonas formosensis]|uniref:hypothetical protein n=1 Tax=Flavisphingomonas formosensis TaxID=861534 RepID=UPI0012FC7AC0|nr:hypothetical protein [Sphingomonas formosensis]
MLTAARHLLAAVLLVAFAAISFWSPRSWSLTDRPRIDLVAPIPKEADLLKMRRFVSYGITIPKTMPDIARLIPGTTETAPALGYSFREVDILRMPIFAYEDQGYVMFVERAGSYQAVPLDADYLKLLRQAAGRDLSAGYSFSVWPYLWGWSMAVGFLLWLGLQVLDEKRRRDASGIL